MICDKEDVFEFLNDEYGWLRSEPYLSMAAELGLLQASEHGSKEARHQLLRSWFHLALYEASKYCPTLEHFPDLVQWGEIGALRALDRFNLALGHRFSTYAGFWIRQSIRLNIPREVLFVRVPSYIWEDKEKRAKSIVRTVPLDGRELAVTPERSAEETDEIIRAMEDAVESLPEREQFIFKFRLWGDTLKEIGCALGLSRERVRQLEVDILRTLRAGLSEFESVTLRGTDVALDSGEGPRSSVYQTMNCVHDRLLVQPSIYRSVRDWVIQTGYERPQLTDRVVRHSVARAAFEKFFDQYEEGIGTSCITGMADVVGDRRLITEKLMDAVGLERIWSMKWSGPRCSVSIRCGGSYTLNVDADERFYSLAIELSMRNVSPELMQGAICVPAPFRVGPETVGANEVWSIKTMTSRRARAEDLGCVIRSLIGYARTCEIGAAMFSAHGCE